MKVSEKSLELNVGAELLARLRGPLNMPKAYLRGLTQKEEKQEGVDFDVNWKNNRIYAFQFKAPVRQYCQYFQFRLNYAQHETLYDGLAQNSPNSVYYVFPFYYSLDKLIRDVPNLADDTWLLEVSCIRPSEFNGQKTITVNCASGKAYVNPRFDMTCLSEMDSIGDGIEDKVFTNWYRDLRKPQPETERNVTESSKFRMNPMIVRGLRVAIIPG